MSTRRTSLARSFNIFSVPVLYQLVLYICSINFQHLFSSSTVPAYLVCSINFQYLFSSSTVPACLICSISNQTVSYLFGAVQINSKALLQHKTKIIKMLGEHRKLLSHFINLNLSNW
jgi:hypothetical protein